jgi:ketosteroid isomerase-like protein
MATEELERANAEALKPVYEEWKRGNYKPRFAVYAPDFEWGWSEEFPDLHGVKPDPNSKSVGLKQWLSSWEDWRVEDEEYRTSGDHVVVLTRYTGRGKESGASVDSQGAHLWTMRDGKAIRLEIFSDRERALEAVGLGP